MRDRSSIPQNVTSAVRSTLKYGSTSWAIEHTLPFASAINIQNVYTDDQTKLKIVRSTRPSYEYHAPFVYLKPTAKLEAVDTPPT